MAFFPAGSRSTWTIPNEVRKLALCRHSMPRLFGAVLRAWNKAFDILTGFSAGVPQPGKRPAAQTGARVASA
jgi:hypothetical protein